MKIIIYTSNANLNPHNGVLLDIAEDYIQQGHEVIYITCDRGLKRCFTNPLGCNFICKSCELQQNFLISKLSKKINKHSLSSFLNKSDNILFTFNNIQDIQSITYKGVDIGYAALSSYYTLTRNLNPEFNSEFIEMMDDFLLSAVVLTDAIEVIIERFKPDLIFVFNARFFESRPVLRVARFNEINVHVCEVTGLPGKYRRVFFENVLPHDINYNTYSINHIWDTCSLSIEMKIKIGSDFFIKKKEGQAVIDKSYTSSQRLGKLPAEWNDFIQNIVIFNSSEDEFAAVGTEYEEKLFTSQIEGINYILSEYENSKNIHFYLRIHPNLSKIQYKYHLDLLDFSRFNNCTVIRADSDISTYSLIDNADKIIVFGSSVGVEANFWQKPVILLGSSFYKNLDIAYYPTNKEELLYLLSNYLSPKDKINSIKYGFFALCERGESYKYFNFNPSGIKALSSYQKFWGSHLLYYLFFISYFSLIRKIVNFFSKKIIPINER